MATRYGLRKRTKQATSGAPKHAAAKKQKKGGKNKKAAAKGGKKKKAVAKSGKKNAVARKGAAKRARSVTKTGAMHAPPLTAVGRYGWYGPAW
jgi:hypothetical protein